MSSLPPIYQTPIFNSAYFSNSTDPLTLSDADQRYLQLGGGFINGNLNVSGVFDSAVYQQSGTILDFSNLGLLSGITAGVATANKLLSTNSSNGLTGLGSLQFNTGSTALSYLRQQGTISGSNNLELYSQTNSTNGLPMLNFNCANNSGGSAGLRFIRFGDYNSYGSSSTYNSPFDIMLKQSGAVQGYVFGPTNTVATSNMFNNFVVATRNGTNPIILINDIYEELHLIPVAATYASQQNYPLTIGGATRILGANTMLQIEYNGSDSTQRIGMVIKKDTSWEISVGGSSHPTVPNGMYFYNSTHRMVILPSGFVGIGTTTPSCYLDVSGTTSVTTTNNIAVNTYLVSVNGGSTVTSSNQGGGPYSTNMTARFRGAVWIQSSIYSTSDRRLKTDINPLDISLEHYAKLNPVSFRYKNESNTKLGLIAQEVMNVCGESIMMTDNENLIVEEEGDIAGVQIGVDYGSISVMSICAIKKLIAEIDDLKSRLSIIENASP